MPDTTAGVIFEERAVTGLRYFQRVRSPDDGGGHAHRQTAPQAALGNASWQPASGYQVITRTGGEWPNGRRRHRL